MNLLRFALLAGLALVSAGAAVAAKAETKVELKGVHLCCPACTKAVGEILAKVDGVKGTCDQKGKTVSLTAKDDATMKLALAALAAGGFHGDTGNKELTIAVDDSGVTAGKVKTLTVTRVHNCCNACNTAIKDTVKKVDGVTGDTAKARTDTFEVTGDFDGEALVKALYAAGFHVKVKK